LRLFPGRKVPAFLNLVVMDKFGIRALGPTPIKAMHDWGDQYLLRTNAPISSRAKASAQRNEKVAQPKVPKRGKDPIYDETSREVGLGLGIYRAKRATCALYGDIRLGIIPLARGLSRARREYTSESASQSWYF
jgi:hypothetical protein